MRNFFKLLIAVLILAAIVLAAPFGMGIVAEKEANKKVKEVQAKLAEYPNVEYKMTSYKRGFFKSEAQELVLLKNIKIDGKNVGPVELIFKDEIKHGPFILSQDSKGKWDFWFGRAMLKGKLTKITGLGANPLPLDFYAGYIGFGGDIKFTMDIPRLAIDLPGFSVILEDFKDVLEISHDHKKVTNQFVLKNALVIDKIKPKKLELKGLELSTDVSKDNQGLWLGSRKIEIESLVAGLEGKVYTLQGLYAKTRDLEHDKQIKSEIIINVRSVGVGEKSYGPHHLALEIDGVDVSIVSKMNETLVKMSQEGAILAKNGPNPAIEAQNQALVNKMGDLASDLIKKGFSINLRSLEATTAWGKLTADAKITIPNLSNHQKGIAQLSLLSSILNMDSMVNAQIPSGLLKAATEERYRKMFEAQQPGQMPQTQSVEELADKHLAKLVADGWFIPKGDLYDITLSFKKGQFLVNNKPLKPQGILPELSQPAVPEMPAQEEEQGAATPSSDGVQPAEMPASPQPQEPDNAAKPEIKQQAQNESVPAMDPLSSTPAVVEKHMLSKDVKDSPISQPTQEPEPSSVIQPSAAPAQVPVSAGSPAVPTAENTAAGASSEAGEVQ